MSEFEMAYLLTEMQMAASTGFGVMLTVVSGFLVAGYVISHRLNAAMIAIILFLYTWYTFVSINILARIQMSIFGLLEKMKAEAAGGKGLEWHAVNTLPTSTYITEYGVILAFAMGAAMYLGSILFFFIARHMNLRQEKLAKANASAAAQAASAPPAPIPSTD
jgi:hypothetical protein